MNPSTLSIFSLWEIGLQVLGVLTGVHLGAALLAGWVWKFGP